MQDWKIDIKSETQAKEEGFGQAAEEEDDDILGDIEAGGEAEEETKE